MKPHYPLPYRQEDGVHNTVINEYTGIFDDGCGHVAEVTYVDYRDKKGVIVTQYPLRYKWLTE